MPSPQTLLAWLLGGAVGLAGILQGLHWKSTGASGDRSTLESQLRLASEENAILRRENESLRSLAQGGGELPVPQEMISRVEKEFGLHFLSSPVLHRIAREELRDRIGAAIESRFGPSGIDDRQESYQLIGWLRPDDNLLAQLTAVRSVGQPGWFDDVTGEAWVTDSFEIKNIPDQATLLSLLARILFHQHFPPTPAYPGDDTARAREALHQGAAAGSEARFYAANAHTIGFIPMTKNVESEQLLASFSLFLQGLTRFPITDGRAYADTLYIQGNESLHSAFRNPPQTTQAIFSLATTPTETAPIELPAVLEEPFLSESSGELGLRLWLDPLKEAVNIAEIASAWVNDRYMLFPDGEQSSAVLWDIELENAAAADKFQSAALARIAHMLGRQEPATPGEALVTPDNRHLLLARISPTRIRFLNTFESSTAATLGSH